MEIPAVTAGALRTASTGGAATASEGFFSVFFEAAVDAAATSAEGVEEEAPQLGLFEPVLSTEAAEEKDEELGAGLELGTVTAQQTAAVLGATIPLELSGGLENGEADGGSGSASAPEALAGIAAGAAEERPVEPRPVDSGVRAAEELQSSTQRVRSGASAQTPSRTDLSRNARAAVPATPATPAAPGGVAAPATPAVPAEPVRPAPDPGVTLGQAVEGDETSASDEARGTRAHGTPSTAEPPAGERARAERLWGFWVRRARGPAEGLNLAEGARGELTTREQLGEDSGSEPTAAFGVRELSPGFDEKTAASPLPVPGGEAASGPAGDLEARAAAERPTVQAIAEPRNASAEVPAPTRGNPYAAERPAPAEQVARGIRLSLSPHGDRVTVRLEPESLGKVEIVLAKGDDGIAAHFRVETPQAHQALVSEAPLLRQALESRGIPLVEVFVDMNDSPRGRGEAGGGRRSSGRRPQHADVAAPEEARPPPGFAGAWGIDTRV